MINLKKESNLNELQFIEIITHESTEDFDKKLTPICPKEGLELQYHLQWAIGANSPNGIKWLIQRGANINYPPGDRHPLLLALRIEGDSSALISALIEAGAEVKSFIHLLNGEMIESLIIHGHSFQDIPQQLLKEIIKEAVEDNPQFLLQLDQHKTKVANNVILKIIEVFNWKLGIQLLIEKKEHQLHINGGSLLSFAILNGFDQEAIELIKLGLNPNEQIVHFANRGSILSLAIENKMEKVALTLVAHGADIADLELTLLIENQMFEIAYILITLKKEKKLDKICSKLLSVWLKSRQDKPKAEALTRLSERVIDLELEKKKKLSPSSLHLAAIIGSKKRVEKCFATKMNRFGISKTGLDVFDFACLSGNGKLVRYLIRENLHANHLSGFGPTEKNIVFHALCLSGDLDLIESYLENHPNAAKEIDAQGNTPLHTLCRGIIFRKQLGIDSLDWAANLINQLVHRGVNINHQNLDQQTPIALEGINSALIDCLIEAGADVDSTLPKEINLNNDEHRLSIFYRPEELSLLIDHGLNVNAEITEIYEIDQENYFYVKNVSLLMTVFILMQQEQNADSQIQLKKTFKILVQQGADFSLYMGNGSQNGLIPDQVNLNGTNILHLICQTGPFNLDLVFDVLDLPTFITSTISMKDGTGKIPLHYFFTFLSNMIAENTNRREIDKWIDFGKMLLRYTPKHLIDIQDNQGVSIRAIAERHPVTKRLLARFN